MNSQRNREPNDAQHRARIITRPARATFEEGVIYANFLDQASLRF